MKSRRGFVGVPLLACIALACSSADQAAEPALTSLAPTSTIVTPPTSAPPATAPVTLPPAIDPSSPPITPATLGQLRLHWTVAFPGDFNLDPSCNPQERECHFYTNIAAYAFSRDGNMLAVAVCLGTRTRDQTQPDQDEFGCTGESAIILYDSASGDERTRLAPAALPLSLAFDPQGTVLAAGLANSDVELWDLSSGVRSGVLSGGPEHVGAYPLAFSPDGSLLVGGGGLQLQLWNWRSSALVSSIDRVIGIGMSPDSAKLVTLHIANDPDSVRVYDLADTNQFSEIPLAGQIAPTEFSFNPLNGWLSTVEVGANSYFANFWSPENSSVPATLDFRREYEQAGVLYDLNSGGFTPDGYFLLTRYGKLTAPEAQPAATGLSETLWACGFALAEIEADRIYFSPPMLYDECSGPQYMYSMGGRVVQPQILSTDGRFIASDDGFGNLRLWWIDASLPARPPECSGACPP
jgi:WD40 repeat protein